MLLIVVVVVVEAYAAEAYRKGVGMAVTKD